MPLLENGILYGVLDVDSASLGRFDESDQNFLKAFAEELMESLHNRHKTTPE